MELSPPPSLPRNPPPTPAPQPGFPKASLSLPPPWAQRHAPLPSVYPLSPRARRELTASSLSPILDHLHSRSPEGCGPSHSPSGTKGKGGALQQVTLTLEMHAVTKPPPAHTPPSVESCQLGSTSNSATMWLCDPGHNRDLSGLFFFLVGVGPRCCAWAFSSCSKRGRLLTVMHGLLTAVASLIAEYRLWAHRLG